MRRIVTAFTAAALALGLVAQAAPASALTAGFDSAYSIESAFLTLNPGQSGTFSVTFVNTGTSTWTTGSSTEVQLAVCLEDKVTCNASDASEAAFNNGWISATRYARPVQTSVGPGQPATFIYNVTAPSGTAAGTHRFNGDLVVSTTGDRIHPEGYFQDVTVPTTVGSCTPTGITTTPTNAQNQVGVTHTQTATVDCDPPAGSTTRPKAANTQVTFIVDAAATDTGNADLTLTATTNDSGIATVSWTRSNPGTDTVAIYPTSTPSVRATATKRWVAGTFTLSCTPTESATQLAGSSRNFTVTVRNPATGALVNGAGIDLTTTTSLTAATTDAPTTIAGVDATVTTAGTTVATVTTGSAGTAVFTVVGTPDATAQSLAITVRAFLENDTATFGGTTNNTLDANEFRVDCGTTTFERLRAATITLTPDSTATNALNGNRVYTVTAVDQFGSPFAGGDGLMRFSFSEQVDADINTTTTARPNTAFSTDGVQEGGTSPTPRTDCAAGANNIALATASSTGIWFVMICASAATTGTPVAWHDRDGNSVPSTGEGQDTGGAKTWAAAVVSSAALSPSTATNTASSEEPVTNNNSNGAEKFTSRLVDQSGNTFAPTAIATVTFSIRNTSSTGNIGITFCGLTANDAAGTTTDPNGGAAAVAIIAPNTTNNISCVLQIPIGSLARAQVEIDRGNGAAGTATVDASIEHSGVNFVATQATKTWVALGTADTARGGTTLATGNVVALDKAQDYYTLSATAGNFTIFYATNDVFTVDGSTATVATFEDNLTVGDKIAFDDDGPIHHALTNQ